MSVWIYDETGNPYSDDELVQTILAYRKAIRDVAMGGGVGVVAGENRRLEFTQANVKLAQTAMRDLLGEASDRGLPIGGADISGSLAVEFGR
jgi:hypothetical protein